MKSKLLKTFFLNTLFSSSLIILFLLIKEQITSYLNFLKETYPKLLELQTALQTNATSNIDTLQSSIAQITETATKFYMFYYILLPFALFLLFILFQGYIFYLLSNSKDIKKYFFKFILATIPLYLLFLLVISTFNIFLIIILLLVLYYALILYLNLNNKLKQALRKSLNSILNIKLFLIYLLLLVSIVIYISAKFVLAITIMGDSGAPNLILSILFLLLAIFLFSLVEIWFSKKI